ncbi:hypothetical protein CW735_02565 [Alteromonas sp. MB-3u-76]|uniref:hypothetical protein n=1 Tax=Alteromonas sp. MB-3u-76 TaxID=2058133 RepID=UPI000C31593F|nr:hypothetical protein [Alteromonas sp. MB-3u-76]AUC87213.1 hypothetical protein CW735_02565 [Alteromonas sp. MB-3u-76]
MKNKLISLVIVISVAVLVAWSLLNRNMPFGQHETNPSVYDTKEPNNGTNTNALTTIAVNNNKETHTEISGIELRRCRNIPKTKDALDTFLDQAHANGESFQYIEDVLNRFELCKQYPDTKQNYIQLLINDANKGSIASLNEIWKIPEAEYFEIMGFDSQSREDIIFNRKEFVITKYRLAHKLATSGNEEAILKLVKSYQHYDPLSQKPNHAKSLAYANFGLHMTQDNDYYLKLDWFKQRILGNSSPEEVESAFSITEQLLIEADRGGN